MRPRLQTLLALALPTVLARASQAVITFADVIQVKHLGNTAIAATASGGLNSWMFIILPMGIAFITIAHAIVTTPEIICIQVLPRPPYQLPSASTPTAAPVDSRRIAM